MFRDFYAHLSKDRWLLLNEQEANIYKWMALIDVISDKKWSLSGQLLC